jgi:deoxyribonuclease V
LAPREAAALQRQLARDVRPAGKPPAEPFLVAGCDASGSGRWARGDEMIVAGILVFRFPGWELVDHAHARGRAPFPYIPGLLSFREVPLYVAALRRLREKPALLLCDGQGIAHPRGLGLASHLGLLFDLPTIGVAKSRLIGRYRPPGRRRGCATQLHWGARVVGRVVRTRAGVKPLFISPGHRLGVDQAAALVLRLGAGYRLPEPTRLADIWVGQLRRHRRCPPPPPAGRAPQAAEGSSSSSW